MLCGFINHLLRFALLCFAETGFPTEPGIPRSMLTGLEQQFIHADWPWVSIAAFQFACSHLCVRSLNPGPQVSQPRLYLLSHFLRPSTCLKEKINAIGTTCNIRVQILKPNNKSYQCDHWNRKRRFNFNPEHNIHFWTENLEESVEI